MIDKELIHQAGEDIDCLCGWHHRHLPCSAQNVRGTTAPRYGRDNSQQSRAKGRESTADSQQPRAKSRESTAKSREPKDNCHLSKAKS